MSTDDDRARREGATPGCVRCGETDTPGHECSVPALKRRVGELLKVQLDWEQTVDRLNWRLDRQHRRVSDLEKEVERQKQMRRTEREGLVEWLDRRIEQQEEAMNAAYISGETKRLMEIEISLLRRHRDIVVEGAHRNEDPLMPRFAAD